MRKCLILFLLIGFSTLLAGCAFRDIDKRFFVVAMGVDHTDNKNKPYKVSLKLDIPSAQVQPGKTNYQMLTEEATSIPEAIRVMESKVDKEFDFGHCRILLFDKEILKQNQKKVFDWFIRRRDIQGIAFLAVGEPSAKAVLQIKAKSERLPGNAMVLAFDETVNTSPYVITEILNDYYMRMNEDGIDGYLPVVRPIKDTYAINTCAVMQGTRFKGELNKEDTRMLNEFENTPRRGHISIQTDTRSFFIFVDRLKPKMKLIFPKGKEPYVNVNVRIVGMVEQTSQETTSPKDLKQIEAISRKVLTKRTTKFFKHLQSMGVDPFGLGLKYEARFGVSKKIKEDWKRLYPEMDVNIKFDIDIRGSGTMY